MDATEQDISSVLVNTDLFMGLSTSQLEPFVRMATFGPLRAGELIFAARESCSAIYVLKRGMASVELQLTDGIYDVAELSGPGKALGWSCLGQTGTYTVSARALMASETIALPVPLVLAQVRESRDVKVSLQHNIDTNMVHRPEGSSISNITRTAAEESVE